MNKKVCLVLCSFFCSLLLASCGQENQAIKTSEPTTATATKLSSTNAENLRDDLTWGFVFHRWKIFIFTSPWVGIKISV